MYYILFLCFIITPCVCRVHLIEYIDEEYVTTVIPVRIGALPGMVHTFSFIPNHDTVVPPYHQSQSLFHKNGYDYLYLHNKMANISVENIGDPILGSDTMCKLSPIWGRCDNRIYTSAIPLKCKSNKPLLILCHMNNCPVSFNLTQHIVPSCNGYLKAGSLSIPID